MTKTNKFYKGDMGKLWPYLVELHKTNPQAFESAGLLYAHVAKAWEDVNDKSKCPNCKASMNMYRRKVDYFIVSLLVAMGKIVKDNQNKTEFFTQANRVHVNADERIPHNARNMTGIASALGLIAPVEGSVAHWAITKRGFGALQGHPIQAWVITFRDKIIERSEEKITFAEALANRDEIEKSIYNENEWIDIVGYYGDTALNKTHETNQDNSADRTDNSVETKS